MAKRRRLQILLLTLGAGSAFWTAACECFALRHPSRLPEPAVRRSQWRLPAQFSVDPAHLSAGVLLVAVRDLPDPNFQESVVLLTHHDAKGTLGLILNRPTRLPVSRVFPEVKDPERMKELIFQGGPVARQSLMALLRASRQPQGASRILDDVFFVNDASLLKKALSMPGGRDDLRLFFGYSGWAPGQLEREVQTGSWFLVPGHSSLVFDPAPETLWERLIRRAESRFVFRFVPPEAAPLSPASG